MDFGSRQIRTAGKGSGSIEMTLPTELRDLVGLSCRVSLRDGNRPDLVLQPDMRPAQLAFAALWRSMAASLLPPPEDAPTLPLAEFTFGLQPREGGHAVPFLCWRDGLALSRPSPPEPQAVSRTLAAFGQVLAGSLAIAPGLAAGFGAACGYLAAGVAPSGDLQEACDLAAASMPPAMRPGTPLAVASGCGTSFWKLAGPVMSDVAELFVGWTECPAEHVLLRAAWRRGRGIEMSGG